MKSSDLLIICTAVVIIVSAWVYFRVEYLNSLVITILAALIILVKVIHTPRSHGYERVREIRHIEIPEEIKLAAEKSVKERKRSPSVRKKATAKRSSSKNTKKKTAKKATKKKTAKKPAKRSTKKSTSKRRK